MIGFFIGNNFNAYFVLIEDSQHIWQSGSIKGVRARGGFTIDMEWKESRITRLSVTSHSGGTCRIREATSPHEEVIETEKGKTYQVK